MGRLNALMSIKHGPALVGQDASLRKTIVRGVAISLMLMFALGYLLSRAGLNGGNRYAEAMGLLCAANAGFFFLFSWMALDYAVLFRWTIILFAAVGSTVSAVLTVMMLGEQHLVNTMLLLVSLCYFFFVAKLAYSQIRSNAVLPIVDN